MGFFYLDESIQTKAGFIVGAFVYSENDITPGVFAALSAAGLNPGVDEFKSGARMSSHPEQCEARSLLSNILCRLKIGIVVVPVADRQRLGDEALLGLEKILRANFPVDMAQQLFVDEGIPVTGPTIERFRQGIGSVCDVHLNQDSRTVGGIQLADLAAHSMGVMLIEHLGLLTKRVRAGEESGYDPDLQIELGFELWASLRYAFFKAPQPEPLPGSDDPVGTQMFDVENYGLRIANTCDGTLRKAAMERFGECYLGCIH